MNAQQTAELVRDVGGFTHNPLGFVLYAFEWGKGELEKFPHGPDAWQREVLNDIGQQLKAGKSAAEVMAVLESISSGKGVGKSCLIAWLILWAMSTFEDTRGIVTANTDTQLRTKTWPELSKWYRCCITKEWFNLTATSLYSVDESHAKTWRVDAIPWSKENVEAFAGLHNKGKRILLVFDEASAIDDKIWEVADYALTDSETEIIWVACGNPTRNTGRFIECSGKYRHRWKNYSVDSRTVRITNKKQIDQWIEDEGIDSDVIRVNVLGLPPRSSMLEFIGPDDVDRCMAYKAESYKSFPVIIGMDCARFGDDYNTIYTRQGRKITFIRKWRGLDTQASASHLVEAFSMVGATIAFVDGGGPGGGIIDRAKVLIGKEKIQEVNFGGSPRNESMYANKRAEMWGDCRDAIKAGIELPKSSELRSDLLGPLYSFTNKQQILLEKKSDMKKRGLASPDHADAVVLTFARNVIAAPKKPEVATVQIGQGYWG